MVPYFILLLLIGIPLFFLELAVGQRIRRGSIGVWNYVYPQLGGIGVSSLMVSVTINVQMGPNGRTQRQTKAGCKRKEALIKLKLDTKKL